jgi:GT2 family glycosyltransferase
MKYSIIMPYFNRAPQLYNTLVSFHHHYRERGDYEVVLVVDNKTREDLGQWRELMQVLVPPPFGVPIRLFISPILNSYNPAEAFNYGVLRAQGSYIVLTSPEIFHVTNILRGLDGFFDITPRAYIVCACESGKDIPLKIKNFHEFRYTHHMWYQHSKHRNLRYHFCSALRRSIYEVVGGFDKRYALGIAYDDNDFRETIKAAGVPIIVTDDLLTVHMEHERVWQLGIKDYRARLNRNKQLFKQKWGKES